MKITNGVLKVKEILEYMAEEETFAGESQPDPDLFRGQVRDGAGSRKRLYLCCDRTYPDLSGTGAWDAAKFFGTDTGAGSELPGGAAGRL